MNDIMNSKDYINFLNDIKKDAKEASSNAHFATNKEMIKLFWRIGNGLLEKQTENDWGSECIKQLSADLIHDFPKMKAFLPKELKTMRIFAGYFSEEEISDQGFYSLSWDYWMLLLHTLDNKPIIRWYVQKCLKEGWGLESLRKGMEENIHLNEMKQLNDGK